MIRSRLWLLTMAALLISAMPALAYSWPMLFGLPAIFGQETPRQTRAVPPGTRGVCQQQGTCPLVDDCLAAWHKLWAQGHYREALDLARSAVQAAPQNVAAQHAFTVSQLVNDARRTAVLGEFEESEPRHCEAASRKECCPLPLSFVLSAVQMPLLPPGCQFAGSLTPDLDIAACAAACSDAKGCCEKCAKDCKCCCTKSQKTAARFTAPSPRSAEMPTTIVIVREGLPLPPPPLPMMLPGYPQMPAYAVAPPVYAPPSYRPMPCVPVADLERASYDSTCTESCTVAPGKVRVLQRGGMCFVSSPSYEIRCDKVSGGNSERLVLEGSVTLVSRCHGQTLTIEADRVILNLKTDQFQVEKARGVEQTSFNMAPLAPAAATLPMPTAPIVGGYEECRPNTFRELASRTEMPWSIGSASQSTGTQPTCREQRQALQTNAMERLVQLLEMRQAEREAYTESVKTRLAEYNAGKTCVTDHLLEAAQRLVNAIERENKTRTQLDDLWNESSRD